MPKLHMNVYLEYVTAAHATWSRKCCYYQVQSLKDGTVPIPVDCVII